MNLTLGSVGGFLPTIIKGLGKSNADVSAARLRLTVSLPTMAYTYQGSTLHCPALRRRSCRHATPHDIL